MEQKPKAIDLNKPGYIIFLATGIFFLIRWDLSQATIFWGLALVFDPFDAQMSFKKRPFYQKVWLFVHLAILITIFVLMFRTK